MRRYQVMGGIGVPGELGGPYKNLEKGNLWGQKPNRERLIDEVDSDVPVYGSDVNSLPALKYLSLRAAPVPRTTAPRRPPKAVAEPFQPP